MSLKYEPASEPTQVVPDGAYKDCQVISLKAMAP